MTNWRVRDYRGYSRLLKQWDWQWLVTLTFPEHTRLGPNAVKRSLLDWTRNLCISERIRVGYYYVLCYYWRLPHLHLLMIGRGKSGGMEKTLLDVNRRKWQGRWPHIAKVEIPKSNSRAAKYVAAHAYRFKCDRVTFDCYDINLLIEERVRI